MKGLIEESAQESITIQGMELVLDKIEHLTLLAKESRVKIAKIYPLETQKLFYSSLDQLLFNVKKADALPLLNKSILLDIEEAFFDPNGPYNTSKKAPQKQFHLHKSLEGLKLEWGDAIESLLQKEGPNRPFPLYFIPLLSQEAYALAYKWLIQGVILNKICLKVFIC